MTGPEQEQPRASTGEHSAPADAPPDARVQVEQASAEERGSDAAGMEQLSSEEHARGGAGGQQLSSAAVAAATAVEEPTPVEETTPVEEPTPAEEARRIEEPRLVEEPELVQEPRPVESRSVEDLGTVGEPADASVGGERAIDGLRETDATAPVAGPVRPDERAPLSEPVRLEEPAAVSTDTADTAAAPAALVGTDAGTSHAETAAEPPVADADAESHAPAVVTTVAEPADAEPADAETADAEPAQPDPTVGGRRRRRARLLPLAVLAALSIALVAVVVVLGLQLRHHQQAEKARASGLTAARDAARVLFSYDYKQLDKDFGAGLALTTGGFHDDYANTTDKVVRPVAQQYQVVVKADVPEAAVVQASPGHVLVIVFVDQTTTRAGADTPKIDQSRIRMGLKRVGGKWLVDRADAL